MVAHALMNQMVTRVSVHLDLQESPVTVVRSFVMCRTRDWYISVKFMPTNSIRFLNLDINECESEPCHNEGMCIDEVAGYECQCQAGYAGAMCNIGNYEAASLSFSTNVDALGIFMQFSLAVFAEACEFPTNWQHEWLTRNELSHHFVRKYSRSYEETYVRTALQETIIG